MATIKVLDSIDEFPADGIGGEFDYYVTGEEDPRLGLSLSERGWEACERAAGVEFSDDAAARAREVNTGHGTVIVEIRDRGEEWSIRFDAPHTVDARRAREAEEAGRAEWRVREAQRSR